MLEVNDYTGLRDQYFKLGKSYFNLIMNNVGLINIIEWLYYIIACNCRTKNRFGRNDIEI